MHPRSAHLPSPRRQRGASLLVVVTLLLGMALMALTAFQLSRGQYQLVGNVQHLQQAFVRAEAASATAEQWLASGTNARSPAFATLDRSAKGLYPAGSLAALQLNPATMTWDDSNSIATADGRYLVEQMARGVKLPGASVQLGQRSTGACKSVDLFRIVASSTATRGAARLIETVYATDGCY